MAEPGLFERQMLAFAGPVLGATESENRHAIREGNGALTAFRTALRERAREVLDELEREHRVGIVLLGRPYHNDPGLNHEIIESLQKCGYPVFTIDSLPVDPATLHRLFGDEVARGAIRSPMDITDVWKNAYSENSSRKMWGAKWVARHPNLVALDLSSFKCGHDAPMYHVIESIVEASATPYFTFHDIDENKPVGSIRIRVETIAYFLQRYQEDLLRRAGLEDRVRDALAAYEERLRRGDPFVTEGQEDRPASSKPRWTENAIPLDLVTAGFPGGGQCSSGTCGMCAGCARA
jgi:predicted nucleotide-binding protein (sugar kinase/HSP70/actin superfamily)